MPHAVVVTVREEGRPPSRGQLSLARSPLSARARTILRSCRTPPANSKRRVYARRVASRPSRTRLELVDVVAGSQRLARAITRC